MSEPQLLARMGSGAEWDDPSEDLLFELMSDIDRGDERSMTVEHLDEDGRPLVRVSRSQDGRWVAEMEMASGGVSDRKSWDDLRQAHRWLTSWTFRIEEEAEPPLQAFAFGMLIHGEARMPFVIEDIHALSASSLDDGYSDQSAGIGIMFEIPARTFEGVQFRRFDRKTRSIEFDVAVPANLAASDTSSYLRTTFEVVLEQAEAYLVKKKLVLGLHEARAAIARAVADLPDPPLSESERYREVKPGDSPDRPVRTCLELDGAGRDLRRVEVYADGRMDYAVAAIETGTTGLSGERLTFRASADQGRAFPKDAFLALWDLAISQPAPRGPIRVVDYPKPRDIPRR
jgi:hypothetical protein